MSNNKTDDLVKIIKVLRGKDGCPWDRKQTVTSFRPYLVEELYELLEAVDDDHPDHICDELGDMLFQLLFLGNLYEEQGLFTIEDSFESICAKMIRRHPHVFGDARGASEEEIRDNWKRIKNEEKAAEGTRPPDPLAVPSGMPALGKAHKVSARAARTGFEWPDTDAVFAKLDEEISEMREAVQGGNIDEMLDELGDILFVVVNLARTTGLDSETALNRTTKKFIRRFSRLSTLATDEEKELNAMETAEMIKLWKKAKKGLSLDP